MILPNQKVRFRDNDSQEWNYGFYVRKVSRERTNVLTGETFTLTWHEIIPRGQDWFCGYGEAEPYDWTDADQPGPEERPWEMLGED